MTWWIGVVEFGGESEVQKDGRCASSYMRKYLVRTDEATLQNELQVATAVGIVRGSPISFNLNAICHKVAISNGPVMTRPPFMAYYATYNFATNATLPDDDDDDPTTTRTLWSISPQIQSRYVIKDRLGKLILNSAGSPYDGGIPVDVRLGTATAKRNIDATGYDRGAVMRNSGKLNSVTFLGGAPETVQVDISAEEKYEGGYHFYAETYTFSYDPAKWQPQPADAGFFQREYVGSDVLIRILNRDVGDTNDPLAPVQEPEPLDANGILVPPGPSNRPANCRVVYVDHFDTMDFNSFGL